MVDVTVKIANLLEKLGVPIELAGSEAELQIPSIYITLISNTESVKMEHKDFLTAFVYQIDIYAETPKRCAEMAQAVDDIMQPEGWRRSQSHPIGRQRYVLTYKALVSEKFNTYEE